VSIYNSADWILKMTEGKQRRGDEPSSISSTAVTPQVTLEIIGNLIVLSASNFNQLELVAALRMDPMFMDAFSIAINEAVNPVFENAIANWKYLVKEGVVDSKNDITISSLT
jgi:hypothetical protein